ncbi:cupin [Trinickia violacea]|uniref:Cupin n=2 Tax=Trinickia violacea TaxID=2571746 RepID=A0A4P8INV7_9BURK|nr:cupin [Trinickia violacea]
MTQCRVFAIDDGLNEVVADGLYMKTLRGQSVSVAVVKFVEKAGRELSAKAHSHGEEASLQVSGSCSIFEVGAEADRESVMNQGDATLIPAGCSHYGVNRFEPAGVSLRLNVVTPPREEYGQQDQATPYYPLADRDRGHA